jgi:glycosyltransferase 2 family protein
MNKRAIVRGIQLIVAITLATFAYLAYRDVHAKQASLAAVLTHLKPGWLVLAAALALQEGVCGGLRMFCLGRVLSKDLRVRTAIISEFVLMFCAGVTPGQAGAAPAQVAVLVHGGMRLVDVATASLVTAACTIVFFLASAVLIFVLRATGHFAISGGVEVDALLGLSVTVFGSGLVALILCAAYPPLLKGLLRVLAIPFGPLTRGVLRVVALVAPARAWAERQLEKPGAIRERLVLSVDDFHEGFRVYLQRGKGAYLTAQLLTFGFFCSRFAVAYFILLGLGVSTTPATFVTIGPPIVQVVLVQALLNFALYLSPTPGASGIAEVGSTLMMSPWVSGPYELPYIVLWRILALFLCMFVGGVYVFRYLGTDVLEERVKAAETERQQLDEARLSERRGKPTLKPS